MQQKITRLLQNAAFWKTISLFTEHMARKKNAPRRRLRALPAGRAVCLCCLRKYFAVAPINYLNNTYRLRGEAIRSNRKRDCRFCNLFSFATLHRHGFWTNRNQTTDICLLLKHRRCASRRLVTLMGIVPRRSRRVSGATPLRSATLFRHHIR